MIESEILQAWVPAGTSTQCQRILVVEDESDLRQLNAEVLLDASYQVDIAEDGAVAWAALRLHSYDLLITDQFLPKLSGVELLKKINTARIMLPIIMITEILPTWEFALHTCLQAVTMLRKPYTIEKLLGVVKSVLPETAGVSAEFVSASSRQSSLPLIVFGSDHLNNHPAPTGTVAA